jgi:hypothetical protein
MLLFFGLDAMVGIVFQPPVESPDMQKRYRFTPPVSNWRICEALSVDALCGFGAKNFYDCAEFTQSGILRGVNRPWFSGHFDVFYQLSGSVLVRFRRKCLISGRA